MVEYEYGKRVKLVNCGNFDGKEGLLIRGELFPDDKYILLLDEAMNLNSGFGRAISISKHCLKEIEVCVKCNICGAEEIDQMAIADMYINGWVRLGDHTFVCKSCMENGPKADMVSIPVEEYDEMLEQIHKLECLEGCGVDNWCGYDDAMEMFHMEDE